MSCPLKEQRLNMEDLLMGITHVLLGKVKKCHVSLTLELTSMYVLHNYPFQC